MEISRLFEYINSLEDCDWYHQVSYLKVAKGEYVYLPHNDLPGMYEVLAGVVKIGGYSPVGEEIVYDVLKPGDFFGNLRYFKEGPVFREFAKALTDTALRLYNLPFFKSTVVKDERMAEWFNVYVVSRWCRIEGRFFSINANTPSVRIAALERELGTSVEDASGRQYIVFELLSQKDIAHLTGTTRQTVASVLRNRKDPARG